MKLFKESPPRSSDKLGAELFEKNFLPGAAGHKSSGWTCYGIDINSLTPLFLEKRTYALFKGATFKSTGMECKENSLATLNSLAPHSGNYGLQLKMYLFLGKSKEQFAVQYSIGASYEYYHCV